jgi:hypothetical protein
MKHHLHQVLVDFFDLKNSFYIFIQPIEDDDDDEDDEHEPTIPVPDVSENPSSEPIESTLTKKRSLTDDDEEGEDTEIEKLPNEDIENDELAKQRRKKKSRWGSEQDEEESPEKQATTKRSSEDEDNLDNSSTTSSNKHRDRDYHRSSRHDDDRHHSSRHSERYEEENHFRDFILFYRSTEKEIPLPEEEIVQFNPEDVVLDFCKLYLKIYRIKFILIL